MLMEGRWAQLIEVSNDKGPYKIARVQSEGHEFDVTIVEPSGVQTNPLKESQIFVFPMNSDTGQAIALALPPPAKRTDEQKEGEAWFGNHKQGQFIKMDDDGNIVIKPKAGGKIIIEGVDGSKVEIQMKADIKQTEGNIKQDAGGIESSGTHKASGHI